ncbi:MAG: hypothetical protein ABII90_10255 [Bacteroidota bacterium]
MNYRKTGYVIFALLISVSVFGIDFSQIRAMCSNDSTGLDTAVYVGKLQGMIRSEERNYQHYRNNVYPEDSVMGVFGMEDCLNQKKEIIVELLSLSGADSTEIVDISKENNISALWAIPAAVILGGVEAIRRWRAKRKAVK